MYTGYLSKWHTYFSYSSEQIQGLPARIDSKEELCDIVTRLISHLTIGHAAVNYEPSDYAEYIPNLPTKLYNDTRVEEGEFSVYRLPNRYTSAVSCRVVDWKEGPTRSKIEAAVLIFWNIILKYHQILPL